MNPDDLGDDLVLDFVPALVAVLLATERAKGEPLAEAEVLAVRDGATCVRVPRSVAAALAEQRGYDDLDPERVWEEWQAVRRSWE
ncbi:hypothetical protein INN71_11505 [Nocardioides sp. ChNu-153]|uniref:hypothetical protein n=1 Tax=unclassified Nocardioides TaxID=2615069 RepID=UPI0024069421|nr:MULTISPECIES: hypothetical protein [unclassified Nocardioides]MDF9716239.1 hypothetical protein [Nocardioides sp. ChNu-99]MDN7122019.1 hypothetical protein [Nocardioides sp. ChNu-153]